jgi:hypothetical protein
LDPRNRPGSSIAVLYAVATTGPTPGTVIGSGTTDHRARC